MYGYIYKTTNLVNGKIYIGQKKSNEFLADKYLGSGKYLRCAIQHYGECNFTVELLAVGETKQQLDELEKFYIKVYNSTNKSIGYNIAKGAVGGDTYSGLSESDKELRRLKMRGGKGNEGYKRIHKGDVDRAVPQNTLDKFLADGWELGVSDRLRQIASTSHKGISRTDEWKQKISQSLLNMSVDEKNRLHNLRSESTKQQMLNTPKSERIARARNANKFNGNKCAWVNNGKIQHFIYLSELQSYIDMGYSRGMLKRRGTDDE